MKGLELARLNTGPFSLALHIKFHRHCSVMWLSSRSIMLETTEIRGSSVLPFFRMRRGGASFLQMLLCHMGQILLHAAIAKENYPESEKEWMCWHRGIVKICKCSCRGSSSVQEDRMECLTNVGCCRYRTK